MEARRPAIQPYLLPILSTPQHSVNRRESSCCHVIGKPTLPFSIELHFVLIPLLPPIRPIYIRTCVPSIRRWDKYRNPFRVRLETDILAGEVEAVKGLLIKSKAEVRWKEDARGIER